MEINATVRYQGALASFEINREMPGIYYANLLSFEGERHLRPPGKVTLIRGIHQWAGSYNDKILINQLGKAIEDYMSVR